MVIKHMDPTRPVQVLIGSGKNKSLVGNTKCIPESKANS